MKPMPESETLTQRINRKRVMKGKGEGLLTMVKCSRKSREDEVEDKADVKFESHLGGQYLTEWQKPGCKEDSGHRRQRGSLTKSLMEGVRGQFMERVGRTDAVSG